MPDDDLDKELEEQLRQVDDWIARQEKWKKVLDGERDATSLNVRIQLLEEQVYAISITQLLHTKALLMHSASSQMRTRIEKERREAMEVLKIFMDARTIGKA